MFAILNNNYFTMEDITVDDEYGNNALFMYNFITEKSKIKKMQ